MMHPYVVDVCTIFSPSTVVSEILTRMHKPHVVDVTLNRRVKKTCTHARTKHQPHILGVTFLVLQTPCQKTRHVCDIDYLPKYQPHVVLSIHIRWKFFEWPHLFFYWQVYNILRYTC